MEPGDGGAEKKIPRKKLVVVGDGACGKTCLLIAYTRDEFSETHIPTVFETYVTDIKLNDKRLQMALWDTAGQEDYELLRPLSYPNTDVLLLCFAIDNRDSFENIFQKWVPEVRHFCPRTPLLLVGTKTDLRAEPPRSPANQKRQQQQQPDDKSPKKTTMVSVVEGQKMAKSISADGYEECSAKTREGIEEVFQTAARIALGYKRAGARRIFCSLL